MIGSEKSKICEMLFTGKREMASFSDECWERAFSSVSSVFELEKFHEEQTQAIRAFFQKTGHVFVNLPTGYGKSLIFQSLPIVADSLFGRSRGSSIVVVISPLVSFCIC